jgi:hypothetical protein
MGDGFLMLNVNRSVVDVVCNEKANRRRLRVLSVADIGRDCRSRKFCLLICAIARIAVKMFFSNQKAQA